MPKAAKIMKRKGSVWRGAKAHSMARSQPRPTVRIAVVPSVKIAGGHQVLRNAGSVKRLNVVADADIVGACRGP